ncbi:MAG: helix-turn-helix transcriptional regulator [Deltaproteobacteria bacterium]|nr:helix-turn-helix transcriptional regulator [Deltaproteobacteria bacterium]
MGVGASIRHFRKQQGLTLSGVSARCGLAVSYLSRLETGRVTPKLETLRRVADALDIAIESILGVTENAAHSSCPISPSGTCYLDTPLIEQLQFRPGKAAVTRTQLEVLCQVAYLLNRADEPTCQAIRRVVGALVTDFERDKADLDLLRSWTVSESETA